MARICHACETPSTDLAFCEFCHLWYCLECTYKTECIKLPNHSPISTAMIQTREPEVPLISEMVH